jgi:hypothetical protein
MKQFQQHYQSSQPTPEPTYTKDSSTFTIHEYQGKTYSDQTGKFPVQSSRGFNYILIFYHHDSNAIIAKPLKRREQHCILEVLTSIIHYIKKKGFPLKLHIMDNEAPQIVIDFLTKENITYQKVPPYTHRANTAERAIQTFKSHFVSGLASTPTNFPMHLWCRLLPQAQDTLNMLRTSNINPNISAYTALQGHFNFMQTPMAPPGNPVLIHQKQCNNICYHQQPQPKDT